MRSIGNRVAFACLVAVATVAAPACSSSTDSTASSTNETDASPQTATTIPPPEAVTGNLSGPGVTDDTITIGQITTVTGPVPGLFEGANDGLDAWAAWVNDNGGIAGRQVRIERVDDGFNCTTYTNAMQEFATSAFAVVGNLSLMDSCGKDAMSANPNLVNIQALMLDLTLYDVPNAYTTWPTPPGGSTTGLEYIKEQFPDAIAHAAQLVGQAAAPAARAVQLTAESLGYTFVYSRVVPNGSADFTSDILRMIDEGVRFVDMSAVDVATIAQFLQQAAQQNFRPDVLYSAPAYDAQLFDLLGDASLADGVVWSAVPYSLYLGQDAPTVPAVSTFLTWMGNANPGVTVSPFAVQSWSAGQLLLEAMRGAGAEVTPSSVLESLQSITSFDADGLIAEGNPGEKQGSSCVVMANVQDGEWLRVEPSSGFDCSGSYIDIPLSELSS